MLTKLGDCPELEQLAQHASCCDDDPVDSAAQSLKAVPNVAALSALPIVGLTTGALVYVNSLKDFYRLDTASVAATDATNFMVVATSGAGRWFRQVLGSAEWATTLTWFIDPAAGNNESSGATVGAPLRTWSELERRLRGQVVIGTQTVTLAAGTFSQADPFTVSWKVRTATFGRGSVNIVGTRTVASTTALTAVTAQAPTGAAGGQDCLVTGVGLGAGQVNRLLRFITAASAFRSIAWGKRNVGAGQIAVSNPWPVDGTTITSVGTTNPIAGDSVQDITLTVGTGVLCSDPELQLVISNVRFTNAAGIAIAAMATPWALGNSGPSKFVDCAFDSATTFDGWQFYNCLFTASANAGSLSFMKKWAVRTCFFAGGANFTATFSDGSGFLDANTAFENCGVLFRRCQITDATLAFFNVSATLIDLQDTAQVECDLVWGKANTGKAINMGDAGGRLYFQPAATPSLNVVTSGAGITGSQSNVSADQATLTYECFRDSGDNLIATQGSFAASLPNAQMCPPVARPSGAALTHFRVVRVDPATGQIVHAQADTAAHATAVVGVMASKTTAAAQAASFVSTGFKVVEFDADPTAGDIAYLDAATAGLAVNAPPAVAGTNQKLRLGRVVHPFGGGTHLAIVELAIETFPVVSNGAAP